jgi:hypothetical protein
MPPISKVATGQVEGWTGYAMAAPKGTTGRNFLWAQLCGSTRREVIRQWQTIYANLTWAKAYRRGWRVVRVDMRVARASIRAGEG